MKSRNPSNKESYKEIFFHFNTWQENNKIEADKKRPLGYLGSKIPKPEWSPTIHIF